MTTAPGWYLDTSGLWEYRYFDGANWTDQVSTGGIQHVDPYPPTDQPPAHPGTVLWSGEGVFEREPVRLDLTWQTLAVVPLRRVHETRNLPLAFIDGVGVESLGADGSGSIRLAIRGPGYVGPSTYLLRRVAYAGWGRALILRQRALTTGRPATT